MQTIDLLRDEKGFLMGAIAINIVSFFNGIPPIDSIRDRICEIIALNPWLSSRLLKVNNTTSLQYKPFVKDDIDKYFKVVSNATLRFSMPYSKLCQTIQSIPGAIVLTGKEAIGKDIPLFSITIAINNDEFALIFSLNHVLGDGYTFYRIYQMLDMNEVPIELNSCRFENYEKIQELKLGKNLLWSSGFSLAIIVGLIYGIVKYIFIRYLLKKDVIYCHLIKQEWIDNQKLLFKSDNKFISTNDAVSCWLLNASRSNLGLIIMNLRNRIELLDNSLAGNYTKPIFLKNDDFYSPKTIRSSICPNNSPVVNILSWLQAKLGLITNWTSFYHNIKFKDCMEIVHIPIVMPSAFPWKNYTIIFTPKLGYTACISTLEYDKYEKNGPLLPFQAEFDFVSKNKQIM